MEMKNVLKLLTDIEQEYVSEDVTRAVNTVAAMANIKTVKENFADLDEAYTGGDIRGDVIDAMAEGIFSAEQIARAAMSYMSPDDVAGMLDANELSVTGDWAADQGLDDDEDYDDQKFGSGQSSGYQGDNDYYDADGNPSDNGEFDAGGHYDAERDANRGRMKEDGLGEAWANDDDAIDYDDEDYDDQKFGSGQSSGYQGDNDYYDADGSDPRGSGPSGSGRMGKNYRGKRPVKEGGLDSVNSRVSKRKKSTAMSDVQARSQSRPNYGVKAVKSRIEGRSDKMAPGEEQLNVEDEALADMTKNAGIEEAIGKTFANPQERHTWMMQELNQLKQQLPPEAAQAISMLMTKAGEATVRGGNC